MASSILPFSSVSETVSRFRNLLNKSGVGWLEIKILKTPEFIGLPKDMSVSNKFTILPYFSTTHSSNPSKMIWTYFFLEGIGEIASQVVRTSWESDLIVTACLAKTTSS